MRCLDEKRTVARALDLARGTQTANDRGAVTPDRLSCREPEEGGRGSVPDVSLLHGLDDGADLVGAGVGPAGTGVQGLVAAVPEVLEEPVDPAPRDAVVAGELGAPGGQDVDRDVVRPDDMKNADWTSAARPAKVVLPALRTRAAF